MTSATEPETPPIVMQFSTGVEFTVRQGRAVLSYKPLGDITPSAAPYKEQHHFQQEANSAKGFSSEFFLPDHKAAQFAHVEGISNRHLRAALTSINELVTDALATLGTE